jgi:hypothetical protein
MISGRHLGKSYARDYDGEYRTDGDDFTGGKHGGLVGIDAANLRHDACYPV